MLGFVIGALSLYGLVRVLGWGGRRMHGGCGHRWHGGGWHHGHHHDGHGWERGHGGFGGGRFRDDGGRDDGFGERWSMRRGPGAWLRRLFVRLDTTPGQEKVMRQAAEELRGAAGAFEGELDAGRREIAQAVRSGTVDAEQLGAMFSRHDEKLRELRTTFAGALAKVTDALDEDQRKRLAELIDRGEGLPGFGGPYRNH
jgi:hypothetical protein